MKMDCVIEKSLALKAVNFGPDVQDDYFQSCLDISARLVELKDKLIDVFVKKDRRTISEFEVRAVRDIIDQLLYELRDESYIIDTVWDLSKQLVEVSNFIQSGYFQMAVGSTLVMITPMMIPLHILELELDYLVEPPVLYN
jgi:hypothetical protein